MRLGVLVSHPIQYFSPLFKRLAQYPEIDLTVLYCSLGGAREMRDEEFGLSFAWDTPLLEGYQYRELSNLWRGALKGFLGCINPSVVGELHNGNYDAVMVFGWGSVTTWLAFATATVTGLPWMLYGDTSSLGEADLGWLKKRFKSVLLGSLFRRTGAFLISGAFNRKFYEMYGASARKFFDVPLAVDNDFFSALSERAKARRAQIRVSLGISPGSVVFLFVGKVVEWKRPQDLMDALNLLRGAGLDLSVVYVGDGGSRPHLESSIKLLGIGDVFLLGFRSQAELPEIYSAADVLVLPSSCEPRGLVVSEAMACGLPVIVSDRTGVWGPGDIVRHGENGFVYPCGDIKALAEAMSKLALDPELRSRMGSRSSELIKDFSYDRCVEGIIKALEVVAGREELPDEADLTKTVLNDERVPGRDQCGY